MSVKSSRANEVKPDHLKSRYLLQARYVPNKGNKHDWTGFFDDSYLTLEEARKDVASRKDFGLTGRPDGIFEYRIVKLTFEVVQ